MDDIEVLPDTIRYDWTRDHFTAFDSEANWYCIPGERARLYAKRFKLPLYDAVEELIKFAMIERGFDSAKH